MCGSKQTSWENHPLQLRFSLAAKVSRKRLKSTGESVGIFWENPYYAAATPRQ